MQPNYQPGTLAPLIPVRSRPRRSKGLLWIFLGGGLLLLCCIATLFVLFMERDRIPAVADLFPTRTPPATSTPVATNTPRFTATPSPIPATPTPKSLVLTGSSFDADLKESCSTDVQIKAVNGTSFTVGGSIQFRNGNMYVWCYDARHTWMGTLTYAGYTFESDALDPLQFRVVEGVGYVYIGGKGKVTLPDGSVISLP